MLPAYNEQHKIGVTVSKLRRDVPPGLLEEVVVVDDGSRDGTAAEARAAGATVISQEHNEGVGAAIRTGIRHVQQRGGEIVVVMAGDDQDMPSELPAVVAPILAGACDFVQGSRRLNRVQTVDMPLFRRVTTMTYSLIFRLLTGFPCTDGTNGFRAFTTAFAGDTRLNLDQPWLNTYELEPYLLYHAVHLGYRVREVQTTKVYHKSIGYTKMVPFLDWWNILKPLFYLKLGLRR